MRLLSGRVLLGLAFVGLAGVAGAMIVEPPAKSQPAPATAAPAAIASAAAPAQPAPGASAAPAAAERFVIKRVLPIKGPIRYGEWHWDDAGVPDGKLVITVDLQARVMSVFRDGYEIGAAAVLLGSPDKPTPTGVFPITQKKRHHVSNLYDAPMPYMQRLTNDGVALHASRVELGYASHGCVGMPEEFAARVFGATEVGDVVYITDGKRVGVGDPIA